MKQQFEVDEGNAVVPHLLDRSRINSYKYPAPLPEFVRLLSQLTSPPSSSIKPPRELSYQYLHHLTNHQHRKRPADLLHPGLQQADA